MSETESIDDDMTMDEPEKEDMEINAPPPLVEEKDEENVIPENISDVLTLLKQNLREFLNPMNEGLKKRFDKLEAAMDNDIPDWALIKRELKPTIHEMKSQFEKKSIIQKNVERHIIQVMEESETRAKNAEMKLETVLAQLDKATERSEKLYEKNERLWIDRFADLKLDPVRIAAEELLKKKILESKNSDLFQEQPEVEETEQPAADTELSIKDQVLEIIRKATIDSTDIRQNQIAVQLNVTSQYINKVCKELMAEGLIKKTKKGMKSTEL
jgi:predicted XRE-type DNA-binding protein